MRRQRQIDFSGCFASSLPYLQYFSISGNETINIAEKRRNGDWKMVYKKKCLFFLKIGCIFLDRRGGSGNSRPFLFSIPPFHLPIKKSNNWIWKEISWPFLYDYFQRSFFRLMLLSLIHFIGLVCFQSNITTNKTYNWY